MVDTDKKAMVQDYNEVVEGMVIWSMDLRRDLRNFEQSEYGQLRTQVGDLSIS